MTVEIDPRNYQRLREELVRLRAEPHPDPVAIEQVMKQLETEQAQLKAADGQAGNNPIRNRYD